MLAANAATSPYGVPAIGPIVSMQPPISRPVTSTVPPPSNSQAPAPACFQVVAWVSCSNRHQSPTRPESRWVTGSVAAARSSQWVSPSGAAYGVSARS